MKRVVSLCALVFAAFLAFGSVAVASTFAVDPIVVSLPGTGTSATIAVINQGSSILRLQVTGFAWQQSASGQIELAPSDDLVIFPQMLTLDPGETRRIRVGTTAGQAPDERTFRIFLQELPSLEAVTAKAGVTLNIRMKISIPVFLNPTSQRQVSGAVQNIAVNNGSLDFDVVNTGNTHFSIAQVHVVGKNSAGVPVFTSNINGWYVLAGGVRRYAIKLSKTACEAMTSVTVGVRTDAPSFSNAVSSLTKQCISGIRR